ncbi:CenpB-DNA-bind-domain-containing protein [Didymella exigua CBS 183.55]|uniref:CenpB-DNA-bind-domain-containing protein n=1 Tax=Didymella exigua CBS 183.55 TaxID=1150837 RepID=A0A6A5RE08_9PLEO|nr:CenpB-DNA-bind-domain-containing protein [Didymella exigua CBS 183.55]KAF1925550.1 CenpB-DNA-bind-domain-containing protein [Didymella exigua CBS 183.55]
MDHEHHHQEPFDDHTGWHENGQYPHHSSPVQDFNGFHAYTPMPMEPIYGNGMHPPHPQHPAPRSMHQQLQPLIMPQWPSMLTSQSTYQPSIFPSAPVPITPASATPVSATSTHSRTSSTPRKTLTDHDRRRMCQYHEDNPTVKQTEIGAMFGVERSTVSKVLRQKEKYLYQDDGSRSPIRKSKGKFPDIERALSNWARNHQRQGYQLTDSTIRDKARFFAQTVGNSDSHLKANSTSWLEKFKQKNHLMGAKSRKGSIAEESEGTSNPPSNAQTPGALSPLSPDDDSPTVPNLAVKRSEDSLKTESPDTFDFSGRRLYHSQSTTSLSTVVTEQGPTSPTSPFFTPDSACGPNPFVSNRQASNGQPGTNGFQRPRSQTFPLLEGVAQYASPPASSDAMTPKYISSTALDSPMAEMGDSLGTIDEAMSVSPTNVSNLMQPPPLPTAGTGSPVSPSQEEAARALELVMSFFKSQPSDFAVAPEEYMTMGKLMEKLRIKGRSESMPLGIRRASEPDYTVTKLETVDVLH